MKLRSDVRCRAIAGEGVVLCQERGEVLVVNEVGIRVVELIQRELSVEDIVKTVQEEYDVEAVKAREDVCAFLEELEKAGVVEPGIV